MPAVVPQMLGRDEPFSRGWVEVGGGHIALKSKRGRAPATRWRQHWIHALVRDLAAQPANQPRTRRRAASPGYSWSSALRVEKVPAQAPRYAAPAPARQAKQAGHRSSLALRLREQVHRRSIHRWPPRRLSHSPAGAPCVATRDHPGSAGCDDRGGELDPAAAAVAPLGMAVIVTSSRRLPGPAVAYALSARRRRFASARRRSDR